jgi:lipopolysaccharide transport system permease protein
MSQPLPEEYVIEARAVHAIDGKELFRYRELLFFFTWRDVKVKYKQTALGFLWAILQPLLMTVISTVVAARALHVPSVDMPYPVFAFSGWLLWTVFSSGIINAGNSMVTNAQIIKKIYFPRLIIPVSALLSAVVDFAIAFVVLLPLLFVYQAPVNVGQALLCWPAGLVLTVLGALGPGCLLGALNVKYRDFRYVIPFLTQALLFVTPVFYPVSLVTVPWLKYLLALNPVYAGFTLFRLPLMTVVPDPTLIGMSVGSCALLFFTGLIYFRRTEMYFADLA